jgi:hypothetical protein
MTRLTHFEAIKTMVHLINIEASETLFKLRIFAQKFCNFSDFITIGFIH